MSPNYFSEVISYMYNTVRLMSHILHSILESSTLQNDFKLLTLRFTLYIVKFYGYRQMHTVI